MGSSIFLSQIEIGRDYLLFFVLAGGGFFSVKAEPSNLYSVRADLVAPICEKGSPTPGKRVSQTTPGWEGSEVHHALYLPEDWKVGSRIPVVVEYAGNGHYQNALGDVSTGRVEDACLGYGISGGRGMIWVVLPFIELQKDGSPRNTTKWWGDVEQTQKYCRATVADVCTRYGGDEKKVVLAGFSRGAIACNYIGLHDDEISKLWRAFVCHSHYDGVRQWPYAHSDAASAKTRLARLGDRPQFISHEVSTGPTESYLKNSGITGKWTFEPLPFPNHSDQWVLRDLPIRASLRRWLAAALDQ
jgi:hypothetical protein